MFTSVHTSIKNYCDIRTISASKQGFTKIISDAADLYQIKEYSAFVETAIAQFVNLMQANPDVVLLKSDGELNAAAFCLDHVKANIKSIAGTGRFSRLPQDHAESLLTAAQMETVLTASTQKRLLSSAGQLHAFLNQRF